MRKLYTIFGMMFAAGSALAQTSLPTAVTTIDFEGVESAADLNAEQVGTGLFLQSSDANFGTYYQNNPEGVKASHKNYLIIPTKAFINSKAKNNEQFSIGFWMNAYVANEKQGVDAAGHYYSTAIAAYSQSNSYKTFSWPMFSARTRRTLQINCNGWSDYTPSENVNGANVESNEWAYTKQVESGEVDDAGNPIMVNTDFEDNWHYITITFNGLNAKYYVDGEIMNEWNATANNYNFVNVMDALDALYLGDCGPFWQDKDGAYAYDDIAFYATELAQDQIDLIMRIKKNELTEEDRIILAQSQLDAAKAELENYASEIGDTFSTLSGNVNDWLMEEIGDATNYTTIESINAAISSIQKKQDELTEVVNAYDAAMARISYYWSYIDDTRYPLYSAFSAFLKTAEGEIANPTSVEQIEKSLADVEAVKVDYVFSQILPEDNSGINVTRMIDNPWFCDEATEPTVDSEGIATYPTPSPACQKGAWENSFSDGLRGASDCTMYYTQGRTTWNSFHSSTFVGGVLEVHQVLKNMKPGYYSVSADMVSSSDATDNHVYATANGVTKVSNTFSGNGWDGVSAGVGKWETLTSDKVLVGEDGTLEIGATSTTDGTAYKGWYCVTNFQLQYYGTEYDFSGDVEAKKAEAEALIANLLLQGDKTEAESQFNAITTSESLSDYDKVAQLTTLIADVNTMYQAEQSFSAINSMQNLADNATDEYSKKVYNAAISCMTTEYNSEKTKYTDLDGIASRFNTWVALAQVAEATADWGSDKVTETTNSVISMIEELSSTSTIADPVNPTDGITMITKAMAGTITEFDASEEAPKDITALIVNPSFTGDSNYAWTYTGTCANWYSECEFYNQNFNISQVITSLPAGWYRVAVQGFYRDGGRDEAVAHYNNDSFVGNANLYVKAGESALSLPLVSLGSESIIGESNIDSTHPDGSTYAWYQPNSDTAEGDDLISYPDGMNAVQFCFNKGMYADNAFNFQVKDGDEVTIGISKEAHINYDWTIFDNFQLYYLGQSEPSAIEAPQTASSATISDIYTISGTQINKLQKGINIVKMSDGQVKKILVK